MDDGFGDLGFYTLAILCMSQIFGALVATKIYGAIGVAKTMVLGGFLQTTFIFMQALPVYRVK